MDLEFLRITISTNVKKDVEQHFINFYYFLLYESKLHPFHVIMYKCNVISCYNAGKKGIKQDIA